MEGECVGSQRQGKANNSAMVSVRIGNLNWHNSKAGLGSARPAIRSSLVPSESYQCSSGAT